MKNNEKRVQTYTSMTTGAFLIKPRKDESIEAFKIRLAKLMIQKNDR